MRQNEQVWRVSATVVFLSAFSYLAGLGVRGLSSGLSQSPQANARGLQIASAAPQLGEPDLRPAQLYFEVLRKLDLYYVEDLPKKTVLAHGSIDAMLNDLKDPNTRLISQVEMEAIRDASMGNFRGLGAVLTIRRVAAKSGEEVPTEEASKNPNSGVKTLTVVSVAPNGAAAKAGLLPGDRITEIDGHWVAPAHVSYRLLTQLSEPLGPQDLRPRSQDEEPENKPVDPEREKARKEAEEAGKRWKNATDLPTTMRLLTGAPSGSHELTVERGTPTKTLKVRVELGPSKATMFAGRKLNDTTGYLQLLSFNAGTTQQVAAQLETFQKDGVKNLVVDLRNSAGGSLEAARDVAGMLLGDVKFAVLKERDAARKLVDRPIMARAQKTAFKPARVTVLVDGGTAGTSELLAAALRDHAAARLVGTTTFGDGTEQELVRLDDGSGISLTHAKMLTSRGVDFDAKGLKADVAPTGDPLDAALKALAAAPAAPRGS